jgi:hypothetical protein
MVAEGKKLRLIYPRHGDPYQSPPVLAPIIRRGSQYLAAFGRDLERFA